MLAEGNDYDTGVNTFSPEGRIYQVEYAMQAIKVIHFFYLQLGSNAVGVRTKDGVVLAAERRLPSPLMIPSSLEKTIQIDTHIGAVLAGLVSDARSLIDYARVECQNHRFTYNEPMPILAVAETVADLAIDFGEGKKNRKTEMARPYGVSLLIAGIDENGPALYQTDPSGHYMEWSARAIGPATESAQAMLKDNYSSTMTLVEAERLALQVLKNVMTDKINKLNVELCTLDVEKKTFESRDVDHIGTIISTLE